MASHFPPYSEQGCQEWMPIKLRAPISTSLETRKVPVRTFIAKLIIYSKPSAGKPELSRNKTGENFRLFHLKSPRVETESRPEGRISAQCVLRHVSRGTLW